MASTTPPASKPRFRPRRPCFRSPAMPPSPRLGPPSMPDTVEMMAWAFPSLERARPFWLDYATRLPFDPLTEVTCFADLKKFPVRG